MIIPNIWKSKRCSKPPTSTVMQFGDDYPYINHHYGEGEQGSVVIKFTQTYDVHTGCGKLSNVDGIMLKMRR